MHSSKDVTQKSYALPHLAIQGADLRKLIVTPNTVANLSSKSNLSGEPKVKPYLSSYPWGQPELGHLIRRTAYGTSPEYLEEDLPGPRIARLEYTQYESCIVHIQLL